MSWSNSLVEIRRILLRVACVAWAGGRVGHLTRASINAKIGGNCPRDDCHLRSKAFLNARLDSHSAFTFRLDARGVNTRAIPRPRVACRADQPGAATGVGLLDAPPGSYTSQSSALVAASTSRLKAQIASKSPFARTVGSLSNPRDNIDTEWHQVLDF